MKRVTKVLLVAAGLICFVLGTIGIFLPILPTVPLYLLAAFCFARGSERLNTWFQGTGVYKKYLAAFKADHKMTMKAKISAIIAITALLAFAFVMMKRVPWARWILVGVEAFHIWLFFFHIKTRQPGEDPFAALEKQAEQ